MKHQIKITIAFIALLFIYSSIPAESASYFFAGQRKIINCGIVYLDGGRGNQSSTLVSGFNSDGMLNPMGGVGDLFFLLDIRNDMKPSGWSFQNPLSKLITTDGITSHDKWDPRYWFVDLAAISDLTRMNVLYFPAHGTVALSDAEREKLRRFVDSGGVLWIDNTSDINPLQFDNNNPFFISNFKFKTGASGYQFPVNRNHPLLSAPYTLIDSEIAALGAFAGKVYCEPGFEPGGGGFGGNIPNAFDLLLPVVSVGSLMNTRPAIASNAYGSGMVVATSSFIGKSCFYPLNINSLKFAYNVMSLASVWMHPRKDMRNSGSTIDTAGGNRLLKNWSLSPANVSTITESGIAVYKNVVFYTIGSRVVACDINPPDDLDEDGNPDDGVQGDAGFQNGGQDVIWTWEAPTGSGTLSSPVIASVIHPRDPAKTVEAVLLLSSNGKIFMIEAFPSNNPPAQIIDAFDITSMSDADGMAAPVNPYPPIYINGWIMVTGNDGRLYAYNPTLHYWKQSQGKSKDDPPAHEWVCPTKIQSGGANRPTLKSGPVFGFVQVQAGGAVAGLVTWGVSADPVAGHVRNDHIYSAPIFISNDRLRVTRQNANFTELQLTYKEGNVSLYPEPRLWIKSADPISVINVQWNKRLQGPQGYGFVVVETDRPISQNDIVFAEYSLDYASEKNIIRPLPVRVKQAIEPMSFNPSDPAATYLGAKPALGPDNMMYFTGYRTDNVDGSPAPPSVYGIYNDGTSQSMAWHFLLHAGSNVRGTSSIDYLPPLIRYQRSQIPDNPNSPKYYSEMLKPEARTTPAVYKDKVFVAVSNKDKTPDIYGNIPPQGAILCLKAKPDFTIKITENVGSSKRPKRLVNPTTGRNINVKIWQPNLLANSSGRPATADAVEVDSRLIDYDRGVISGNIFDMVRLRGGLMDQSQNMILSSSMPVWIFLDNAEVPIDFSTWQQDVETSVGSTGRSKPISSDSVDLSGWGNLLWYYIIEDSTVSNSPIVIGDVVYVIADNGTIYALNAETGETNGRLISQKPLWIHKTGSGDFPLGANVSMASSNGVLVVPTNNSLISYTNSHTLVADINRVVELDGGGEIVWSLNAIKYPATVPTSPQARPGERTIAVNRPSKARYASNGDILIVNTGSHQIARVNKGGNVGVDGLGVDANNRSIYIRWLYDRFSDPKKLLRPGQPLKLTSPKDAIMFNEVEPDGTLVYHCIIADSGNYRVLDLVYRIKNNQLLNKERDSETGFILPDLNWTTRTEWVNARYIFSSLQLVVDPNTGENQIWTAITNYRTDTQDVVAQPEDVNRKGFGGAVVALGYRKFVNNKWDYHSIGSGDIIAAADRIGNDPLVGPKDFQVIDKKIGGSWERYILVTDNVGVKKAKVTAGGLILIHALVDGNIGGRSYQALFREMEHKDTGKIIPGKTPIPFKPSSARELSNGHWLITNEYSGRDVVRNMAFSGEVFQYDPSSPNIPKNMAIVWSSPRMVYDPGANPPMTATGRQVSNKSYPLQQPQSAFRR